MSVATGSGVRGSSALGMDPSVSAAPQIKVASPGSRLQSLEDSFYAVLYVMRSRAGAEGAAPSRAGLLFALFLVVVDFAQLMAFVADSKRYNWVQLDWVENAFRVVMGPVPRRFLSASGYTTYLVFFAIVMAAILIAVADVLYVLYAFRIGKITRMWPVRMLKAVVSIFFGSLYLSSFGILFLSLDCHYFDSSGSPARFTLTMYPEVACWGVPNAIVAIFALLGCFLVLVFAFAMTLVAVDPVPSSKFPSSTATPHATFYGSTVRALLVISATVFSSYPVLLALVVLACALFLAGSIIWFLPYYNSAFNALRAGLYGVVAWCAVCAVALAVSPEHPRSITLAFAVGAPVAFGLFGRRRTSASGRRATPPATSASRPAPALARPPSRGHPRAQPRGAQADGNRPVWVYRGRLRAPHEVEIATRFVREIDADAARASSRGYLEDPNAALDYDEALDKADAIFQEGLRRFPYSAIVHLAYANFKRTYIDDKAGEAAFVDRARHFPLDFQLRYMIFRKLKEREGEAASQGTTATMDLVSFVEFKTKLRLAREGHYKALRATRAFWAALLEPDESAALARMSTLGRTIDFYETQAERNYSVLVQGHPRNIRILRGYGAFLESVKNNPGAAEQFYRRADAEEDEQTKKRTDKIGGDDAGVVDHTVDAIIVIDSNEIIQSVNANACKIFGYEKGELKGKRVSVLMPSPFRESHAAYIQNYLRTGVARAVNAKRELPALHRSGAIFPMRLYVTRVELNGQTAFVGSIRPLDNSAAMLLTSPGAGSRITGANSKMAALFDTSVEELSRRAVKDLARGTPPSSPAAAAAAATSPRRGRGGGGDEASRSGGSPGPVPSSWSFRDRGAPRSLLASPRRAAAPDEFTEEARQAVDALAPDGSAFECVCAIRRVQAGTASVLWVTLEPAKQQPGEAVVTSTSRGVILAVNRAFCDMFGYAPSEIRAQLIENLMPLPFSKIHSKFVDAYLRTGIARIMGSKRRVDALHKSGTSFPVQLTVGVSEVNGEKLFSARMIRAEGAEDEEDVYITIDQRGIIQSVKGPLVEVFGFRPAELIGRTMNSILPRQVAAVHDQYLKRINDNPFQPRVIGTGGRTLEAVRRDGSTFPVQIDIVADESLKATEGIILYTGRITRLLDLDGTLTVDTEGKIVSCNYNLCRIFGYPAPESIRGHDITTLIPNFDEEQAHAQDADGQVTTIQQRPIVGKHASGHALPLFLDLSVTNVAGSPYFQARVSYRHERRRSRALSLPPETPAAAAAAAAAGRGPKGESPPPAELPGVPDHVGEEPAARRAEGAVGSSLTLSLLAPHEEGEGPERPEAERRSGGACPVIRRASASGRGAGTGAPQLEEGASPEARQSPRLQPLSPGPTRRRRRPSTTAAASGRSSLRRGRRRRGGWNGWRRSLWAAGLAPAAALEHEGASPPRARSVEPGVQPQPQPAQGQGPVSTRPPAGAPRGAWNASAKERAQHHHHHGGGGGGGGGGGARTHTHTHTHSVGSSKTKETRQRKRRRRVLAHLAANPNPLVRKLWRDLLVCVAVLGALAVGTFIAVVQLVEKYDDHTKRLTASSKRTVLSQLIAIEARTLGLALGRALGADGVTPGASAARLLDLSNQFIDIHQDLSHGLHGFTPPEGDALVELLFSGAAVPLLELLNGTLAQSRTSLWSVGERYHQHALVLAVAGRVASGLDAALPNSQLSAALSSAAQAPPSFLPDSARAGAAAAAGDSAGLKGADPSSVGVDCARNLKECASWYFVIRNGPFGVLQGMDRATGLYVAMMERSAALLEGLYLAFLAAGLLGIVLMGLLAFNPSFKRVLEQRDEVLLLFLEIPKQAVRGLARKRINVTVDSSESSEEEDAEASEEGEGEDGTGSAGPGGGGAPAPGRERERNASHDATASEAQEEGSEGRAARRRPLALHRRLGLPRAPPRLPQGPPPPPAPPAPRLSHRQAGQAPRTPLNGGSGGLAIGGGFGLLGSAAEDRLAQLAVASALASAMGEGGHGPGHAGGVEHGHVSGPRRCAPPPRGHPSGPGPALRCELRVARGGPPPLESTPRADAAGAQVALRDPGPTSAGHGPRAGRAPRRAREPRRAPAADLGRPRLLPRLPRQLARAEPQAPPRSGGRRRRPLGLAPRPHRPRPRRRVHPRPTGPRRAGVSASRRMFGRRLVRLYALSSLLLAACFAATFAAGYVRIHGLDDAAQYVIRASSLRAAALRIVAGARATCLPSLRTPEVEAAAAAANATGSLDAALTFAVARPWEVVAGDAAALREGLAALRATFTETPGLAQLMFRGEGVGALGADGAASVAEGLHALLTMYADQAAQLALAPPSARAVANPAYQFIWTTGLTSVLNGLAALEWGYAKLNRDATRRVIPVHGGLMAATLAAAFLVVLFQFRPMVTRLRDETKRSHRMLQLIPDEILERVEAICSYVDRHEPDEY
eukprot:tig00001443_g8748.t1